MPKRRSDRVKGQKLNEKGKGKRRADRQAG